jgi:acylphosphatase
MEKAFSAVISGTVQGVFFRQFCKNNAEKMGLKGYVRNLKSGDVELIAIGEEEKLSDFLKLIKAGPRGAKVDNVKTIWIDNTKDFSTIKSFNILY